MVILIKSMIYILNLILPHPHHQSHSPLLDGLPYLVPSLLSLTILNLDTIMMLISLVLRHCALLILLHKKL